MSRAAEQESRSSPLARPLCVDLDGTLVKSDTLLDSLMLLVRTHPFAALMTTFWALQGKAVLKSQVASRVTLDVAHLPYNHALVEYLKTEHASGRKLFLVTGADQKLAARVADHLGLFEEVLASDGTTNLTGSRKLEGLRQRFGEHGYDYIGNGSVDLPLLQHAGTAMIANPGWMLRTRLRSRGVAVEREFNDRPSWPRAVLKSIRLHQWAKNLLILLPLLLAHALKLPVIANAVIAFFCFSLCASATYIVNDLLDIQSDRRHPSKKLRPFAAGNLSVLAGASISILFFTVAFAAATFLLPVAFVSWLLVYLVATLSYSLYLKRVVLLDVILLSGLYTLRVLAGGGATQCAHFSLALGLRDLPLPEPRHGETLQRTPERAYPWKHPDQWTRLFAGGYRTAPQFRHRECLCCRRRVFLVHQRSRNDGPLPASGKLVADVAAHDSLA